MNGWIVDKALLPMIQPLLPAIYGRFWPVIRDHADHLESVLVHDMLQFSKARNEDIRNTSFFPLSGEVGFCLLTP